MKWTATLAVLLLCASVGLCADLKLPAEVRGEPGDFVQVKADTTGKSVSWRAVDPGLKLFPVDLLKDSKTAVVTATKPARYRLWAVTAEGDVPSAIAECIVIIGDPPPGPGPTPPVPPTPIPVDPAADAELVRKLSAALTEDERKHGTDQKAYARKLGDVYLLSAKALQAKTSELTVADLYSHTFEASVLAGVPRRDMALSNVRGVIEGLGTVSTKTVLTGAEKDKHVALWNKIGASLAEAAK